MQSKSEAWTALVDQLEDLAPSSKSTGGPVKSVSAAAQLTDIYAKYAGLHTEYRVAADLETKGTDVLRFGSVLSGFVKSPSGLESSLEAEFCHSSCHSSHKGRSRR